ncbi:pseudouridine kinase isoform X3 [Lolium perenne]|uniref:pseudouridine kinase isoform X3 n=1 Tax=Lolium perenne TaxID=4522 RepID=UPI0021F699A7|nr:pseudouridine kinase isoform X3 [Lolium perenne]
MAEDAASSSCRRMESIRRHLLPRSPLVLSMNPLSAAEAEPSPVIIGGMVLDIHAKPSVPPHPGTTVPGMVKYIAGGVARNIAECMAKLGTQPLMISVVGNDMAGDFLLKYWRSAGLCTDVAYESGVPVLFEPVSVVKSSRIAPIAEHITCTSPNEIELVAMANALSTPGKYKFVKLDQCNNNMEAVDYLFEMLSPAMFFLLEKGIKLLLVTLGSNGVFICCKEHVNIVKDQQKCNMTTFSSQLLEKLEGCFAPSMPVNLSGEGSSRTCVFHLPATSASVISLTGAGDCLIGGVLSSLCGGLNIMQSVAVGIATAKASVESEANIPANFSAASIADEARRTLLSAKQIWCQ